MVILHESSLGFAQGDESISFLAFASRDASSLERIAYGGGSYVAWNSSDQRSSDRVCITQDGRFWSTVRVGAQSSHKVVACAYGGDRWISVVRVDSIILHNSTLLIYYSLNGGMSWQQLSGITMPTLSIDDDYQLIFAEGNWILTGRSLGDTISVLPNPSRIWISSDGANWIDRSPSGLPSCPVPAYGDGVLVVVGYGDRIFRSTDFGVNWSSAYIGVTNYLTSVTYGNSSFVAGGTRNVMTSTDGGVNWLSQSLGNQSISFIAYGSGTFLRGAGRLQISHDGNLWSDVMRGDWPIYLSGDWDAAYGSQGFLLVSGYGNGLQSIQGTPPSSPTTYATNGIVGETYSASLLAQGATQYVAYGLPPGLTLNPANGQILGTPTAIGTYNVTAYAGNVAGFGNFTKFTMKMRNPGGPPAPSLNSSGFSVGANVNRVAYGAGKYLTWMYSVYQEFQSHEISISQDGETWSRVNVSGQSDRRVVACGSDGNRWLSVLRVYKPPVSSRYLSDSNLKIYESLDGGNSWSELQGVSMPTTSIDENYTLIFADGHWVLTGNSFGSLAAPKAETKVWVSQDGVSWVDRTVSGLPYNPIPEYGGGVLILVGEGGMIYRSPDFGLNWSAFELPINIKILSVAWGNGRFVAAGEKGSVFTSIDGGLSWVAQALDNRMYNMSLSYGAGLFYMRTNQGSESSYDGILWTRSQDSHPGAPTKSTYGPAGFITVYERSTALKATGQGVFDLLPPQVVDFAITPALIDISDNQVVVNITVRIIDDFEGFGWAFLGFSNPDGTESYYLNLNGDQRISGNALDGNYQTQIVLPRYAMTGEYPMFWFYLYDAANRGRVYMPQQISDLGFANSFTVQGTSDQAPPVIMGLLVEPGSVDISNASQEITVTARITDDLSGVGSAYVGFSAGPDGPNYGVFFDAGKRISGDSQDGVYRQTISLPRYARGGNFLVSNCHVVDAAGRSRYYSAQQLLDLGFSNSFAVTGTPDQVAPQIIEFYVDPGSVNISDSSQTITVTARITDDLAGLNLASMTFSSPGSDKNFSVNLDSTKRISGTSLDGIYRQQITLPRYTIAGTYALSSCYVQDQSWRGQSYSSQQFASLGFANSFTVTGNSDRGGPLIKGLSISPGTVDITSSSQTVTVTAEIQDDLSGFYWMNVNLSNNPIEPGYWIFFSSDNRISGNSVNGVYQTTFRILRNASPGTYTVNHCNLMDFAEQNRSYDASQLATAGLANSFTVTGTPTIDLEPPTLSLLGPATLIIGKYSLFNDPGAIASDNLDSARTIYSRDSVDTSQAGSFTLNYLAQDEQGNIATPILRTVIVAPNIDDWLEDYPPSWEVAERYVFGGATGPEAGSEPISFSKSGNEATLSVIVRTNDPNVSVWGEVTPDLAGFSSPTTRQTISGIPAANQEGVPAGCQRQEFKMNADGLERGFLRVRGSLGP